MHGVMIKRLGHNVRILDQNISSIRTDHAAGMGTGPQGLEYFNQHELYPHQYCFDCPGMQFLDKDANLKRRLNIPLNLTSWSVLYYRLRANFDSFKRAFCPDPLTCSENEGTAKYDVGKKAINVFYKDSLVEVEFADISTGGRGFVEADLVIVAEGANSTIRQRLLPNVRHQYSGYVAWRGTVPEEEVSEETRKLFDTRFNGFTMSQGYLVG